MCLLVLRLALFEASLRPFILRLRGLEACQRKPQLRIRLLHCFRLRDFRGPCTVHLIDGDELLFEKQFVTVDQVDRARTSEIAQSEAVKQADSQLRLSLAGLQSAQAQYERSKAGLEQSKAQHEQAHNAVTTLAP